MFQKIRFLSLVIILSFSSLLFAEANLFLNPGFEQGSTDMPDNWVKNYWDKAVGTTEYTLLSEGARSGKRCMEIKNNKQNDARIVQAVKLGKNKNYRFSAWVKTKDVGREGKGATISIQQQFSPIEGKHGTSATWEQLVFYIANEQENAAPELSLGIGDYGAISSGTVIFDDASLVEVDKIPPDAKVVRLVAQNPINESQNTDTLGNLLKNPGFEQGTGKTPDSWEQHIWNQEAGATEIVWLSEGARSGTRCIQITNIKENDARLIQPVTLLKNKKYRLSAWIKTKNIGTTGKGAIISLTSQFSPFEPDTGAESWKEIALFLQVNEREDASDTVSIGLGDFGAINTGIAWFDDVTLREVKEIPADAKLLYIGVKISENPISIPLVWIAVLSGVCSIAVLIMIIVAVRAADKKSGAAGMTAGSHVETKNMNEEIEQNPS